MSMTDFSIVREIDARMARMERLQALQHQETRYRLKAIEDSLRAKPTIQSGPSKNLAEYFRPIIQGGVNYGIGLAILLYVSSGGSIPQLLMKLSGLFG